VLAAVLSFEVVAGVGIVTVPVSVGLAAVAEAGVMLGITSAAPSLYPSGRKTNVVTVSVVTMVG